MTAGRRAGGGTSGARLGAALAIWAATAAQPGAPGLASPATFEARTAPARILSAVRPDYRRFISGLRPMDASRGESGRARLYMALVRPGAADPTHRDSAPLAGPGARNDILYDSTAIGSGRSTAWALLLFDHEYFHARHLAGATSLPLPAGVPADVQRHFYEAAAWGFNVAEARAGRYPGLREDEFREALDRYGEHYAALRDLTVGSRPSAWRSYSDLLRRPPALFRNVTTD